MLVTESWILMFIKPLQHWNALFPMCVTCVGICTKRTWSIFPASPPAISTKTGSDQTTEMTSPSSKPASFTVKPGSSSLIPPSKVAWRSGSWNGWEISHTFVVSTTETFLWSPFGQATQSVFSAMAATSWIWCTQCLELLPTKQTSHFLTTKTWNKHTWCLDLFWIIPLPTEDQYISFPESFWRIPGQGTIESRVNVATRLAPHFCVLFGWGVPQLHLSLYQRYDWTKLPNTTTKYFCNILHVLSILPMRCQLKLFPSNPNHHKKNTKKLTSKRHNTARRVSK